MVDETVGKRRGRPPKQRDEAQPKQSAHLEISESGTAYEGAIQASYQESGENWLEGFSAFSPRRAPTPPEKKSFVAISPNSGTISVSGDLGEQLTFHSEDGRGWVSLWSDEEHRRIAIVAEREQSANAVRISRTKGRRYAINAKAFLTAKNLMPKDRVTLDGQWKDGQRPGVVCELPNE